MYVCWGVTGSGVTQKDKVQILVMSVSTCANWDKSLNFDYEMEILQLLHELMKSSK